MTLSDILLTTLRARFPGVTFAVELVNPATKESRLVINGSALEATCCDLTDPIKTGPDGQPANRQSTQLILNAVVAAVTAKLAHP